MFLTKRLDVSIRQFCAWWSSVFSRALSVSVHLLRTRYFVKLVHSVVFSCQRFSNIYWLVCLCFVCCHISLVALCFCASMCSFIFAMTTVSLPYSVTPSAHHVAICVCLAVRTCYNLRTLTKCFYDVCIASVSAWTAWWSSVFSRAFVCFYTLFADALFCQISAFCRFQHPVVSLRLRSNVFPGETHYVYVPQ